MAKETKTNAMRMLERQKVPYQAFTYECDDFIDGIHCADMIQAPHEQSFKTLVMAGKSGYDPCEGYHKDHRLCKRRMQSYRDEEALSGGI